MEDYYKLMGVTPSISQDELHKRYQYLVRALHPDLFSDQHARELAAQEMKRIEEAYEVLSDPIMRTLYDYELKIAKVWTPVTWPESFLSKPPPPPPLRPPKPEPAGPLPNQEPKHAWVVLSLIGSILVIVTLTWIFSVEKSTPSEKTLQPINSTIAAGKAQPINSTIAAGKAQAIYATTIAASMRPGPQMAEKSCMSWSKVTAADEGKTLCVYGKVLLADYNYSDKLVYITFSEDEQAFRFVDSNDPYQDVIAGNCVIGIGEVKVVLDMPYIVLTRQLDSCD